MLVNWKVEVPQALIVESPFEVRDIFDQFTGMLRIEYDPDFFKPVQIICGTYDSDNVMSREAVGALENLVKEFNERTEK